MADFLNQQEAVVPMNRIATIRSAAFLRQQGRCFYCNCPMWQDSPEQFATRHKITARQAKAFQCTAEHLLAQRDGGKDGNGNVAAACRFCNAGRHKRKHAPSPEAFRQDVQQRMAKGRWHAVRP